MSSIATSNMKTINPSQKALKPPKLPLFDIPPRGYTSKSAVVSGKDSAKSMPSKSDKSLWSLYGLIPEKSNSNRQDVVSSLRHKNNPVKSKYTRSLTPNVTKASATVADELTTLSTASPISRLPLAQIQSKNMKSKQLCLGPGSSPQTENSTCETDTLDIKISNISISSKKRLSRTPIHYPDCREQLRQVGDSDQNKDNVVDSPRPAPISPEILSKNNHCYLLQSEASSIKSIFQKPSSFFTMIPKPHQSSSNIISRPPNIAAEMENLNAFESFKLDMGYLGNLIVV
ncbi:hypothetical protein K3495_g10777 [Podosphaera aphanis]|nr:hypothetical protein K3495_g10777 [Podosphaera aphanis]